MTSKTSLIKPSGDGEAASSRATGESSSPRINGIEGLRATATLLVVCLHVWLYASPGGTTISFGFADMFLSSLKAGVILFFTLFFTLSGFLLFRPYAEAMLSGKKHPGTMAYLRKRIRRILPAYWVVLLLVTLVFEVGRISIVTGETGELPVSIILINALLLQNFSPSTIVTGIGPAWSLAVEWAFYLALPVVCAAVRPIGSRSTSDRRRLTAALLPAAILFLIGASGKGLALGLTWAGQANGDIWDQSWYSVLALSFWFHADQFTYGMLVAVLHAHLSLRKASLSSWWRTAAWASLAVVSILLVAAWLAFDRLPHSITDATMAMQCGLLLLLVVIPGESGAPPSVLVTALECKPLATLGLISYSVFLWNEPLALWLAQNGFTFDGKAGVALNCLIVFSASILLGGATYRLVEKPAMRCSCLKLCILIDGRHQAMSDKHSVPPVRNQSEFHPVQPILERKLRTLGTPIFLWVDKVLRIRP